MRFIFTLFLMWSAAFAQTVSGELRQWHDISLTFDGPSTSETANPNPFTDYRFDVLFTKGTDSLRVPGYFAADGNAAETGAASGNKWRVHFRPPLTGTWNYLVYFTQGPGVALGSSGSAVSPNGQSGSLTILQSGKPASDFRTKGRLEHVGQHYRQFAGSGEWFLNVGADSPENLLAYFEFDQTANDGGTANDLNGSSQYFPGFNYAGTGIHHFAAHLQDWQAGDPTWQGGKGKHIIGAVNYLASQGMNAYSALLWSVGGDGDDTWPYIADNNLDRFDCSKLAQWAILFTHGERKGMLFHAKLFETENDQDMTDPQWQLYFREMVARFGHYLVWEWNLGEETSVPSTRIAAQATYLRSLTDYPQTVVLHTYPTTGANGYDRWLPHLGDPSILSGISVQVGPNSMAGVVNDWRPLSNAMGHPWIVNWDEQGSASIGVSPDQGYPGSANYNHPAMRSAVWRGFVFGLEGFKSYFGYQGVHNDLDLEDYRSRADWWRQLRILRGVFESVPFQSMYYAQGLDQLSNDNFVLTDEVNNWLIYCRDADNVTIPMPPAVYQAWLIKASDSTASYMGTFFPSGNGGLAQITNGNVPITDWVMIIKRYDPVFGIDLTPEEQPRPELEDGFFHVEETPGANYYRIYDMAGRLFVEGQIQYGKIPAYTRQGLWVYQTYTRRWTAGVHN